MSAEVPSGGEWCVQASGNHQLFSKEKDSFIKDLFIITQPHSHADEAACVATLTFRIDQSATNIAQLDDGNPILYAIDGIQPYSSRFGLKFTRFK